MIRTEVLIVGGGLVGGTLACALAQAGVAVAVIDRDDPAAALVTGFDGRASAIALGAQRVMAGIGLWPLIAPAVEPIREIRVCDEGSPLFLHYDHRLLGDDPLGGMVENRVIRRAILARLAALPAARLLAPRRLAGLVRGADGVDAVLADGERIRARLAVAADGRDSSLRQAAGIATTGWDYGQDGIVCTVAHERPHDGVAVEYFLPAGPFAILPLSGRRSSIVWTERRALAGPILAEDAAGFAAELGARFGDHLGAIAVEGPRFRYPLSLQFAQSYTAERLALVGDAAHAIHPIAGQGLNLGIRDVAALAEIVVDALRLGLDPGAADRLERFQRWRRFASMVMLGLTDALNRLFSTGLGPLRLARDLGLAAVDRLPPLKKLFMRHAMGLAGDLPRLTRGEAL